MIDVDVGLHRCGIPPGQSAVTRRQTGSSAGLRFRGKSWVMGGSIVSPQGAGKEEAAPRHGITCSYEDWIEQAGIPVEIVSAGGGTGSYESPDAIQA